MKVLTTYIVKYGSRLVPLFECEGGKWYFHEKSFSSLGASDDIRDIREEEARNLIGVKREKPQKAK